MSNALAEVPAHCGKGKRVIPLKEGNKEGTVRHFEVIHKPTFTNQLLTIPKEQIVQILEKIEYLRTDPIPDGKLKKKLKDCKGNVYRLRSGDYRIIFSFGDGYVALLGVDRRVEVYRREKQVEEEVAVNVASLPSLDDLLAPNAPSPSTASTKTTGDLLPVKIDEALLTSLLVSNECSQRR